MSEDSVQRLRNIAVLMADIAIFNARIEGMKAENAVRASSDLSPAYDEAAFQKVIEESGVHWNAASTTLSIGL